MKRHVVLTSGRSGSNHLVAAINQHPALCNFGEVLGPWTLPAKLWSPARWLGASEERLLETVYSSRAVYYAAQSLSFVSRGLGGRATHFRGRHRLSSLGVKEFFIHLRDPAALAWFRRCDGLSIIHLKRDDLLARALSVHRLNLKGRAVTLARDVPGEAMSVDPEALLGTLDALKEEALEEERLLEQLSHHRRLSLVYERDLASSDDAARALEKVHEFLEVESVPLSDTGHRSAVRGRPIEAVENRAEVEAALKGSQHAELLLHAE
ncbi:MAG: hypothetical protein MK291_05690 [Planctomycetes bacterium]|nr:hypothetical protein [Planctomycetota bacterium]